MTDRPLLPTCFVLQNKDTQVERAPSPSRLDLPTCQKTPSCTLLEKYLGSCVLKMSLRIRNRTSSTSGSQRTSKQTQVNYRRLTITQYKPQMVMSLTAAVLLQRHCAFAGLASPSRVGPGTANKEWQESTEITANHRPFFVCSAWGAGSWILIRVSFCHFWRAIVPEQGDLGVPPPHHQPF